MNFMSDLGQSGAERQQKDQKHSRNKRGLKPLYITHYIAFKEATMLKKGSKDK